LGNIEAAIGMKILIAVVILLIAFVSANSQPSEPRAKHRAIYAPPPEYPLVTRQRHWTGGGLFLCNLRPDGTVSSVKVLQTTGHDILDQAGTSALAR
jgi:outer membrane biosynthesis protein TonB